MRSPRIKEIPGTSFGIVKAGHEKWRYYVYAGKAGESGDIQSSEEAEEKIAIFLLKQGYKVQMTLFGKWETNDDTTER